MSKHSEINEMTHETPLPISINTEDAADKHTNMHRTSNIHHSKTSNKLHHTAQSTTVNPSLHTASESSYRVGYSGNSTELTACSEPATCSTNELSVQTQSQLVYYGDVLNTLIIAQNVNRLPMESIVQVHLKSMSNDTETTVLCSIDVLRMKSVYFQHILEQALTQNRSNTPNDPIKHHSNVPPINQTNPDHTLIIDVQEEFPFDAAALLESLHDGRTLFKGEWNSCWARLRLVY